MPKNKVKISRKPDIFGPRGGMQLNHSTPAIYTPRVVLYKPQLATTQYRRYTLLTMRDTSLHYKSHFTLQTPHFAGFSPCIESNPRWLLVKLSNLRHMLSFYENAKEIDVSIPSEQKSIKKT